jgi:C4-dicarboxylate-specific signal transduction histidine kinase
VRLHVADDGPGVPADLRGKIFEPLFTTKARGIGLGLAVSRSLAEANDGTLELDDTAGGARFTLSLPRDDEGRSA